jgi:hypothetical protein
MASSSSIEKTFQKIKQNRPIQECLNTIPTGSSDNIADTIWFIYYMFFAIHNPKMEEYIQKKLTPAERLVAASLENSGQDNTTALAFELLVPTAPAAARAKNSKRTPAPR